MIYDIVLCVNRKMPRQFVEHFQETHQCENAPRVDCPPPHILPAVCNNARKLGPRFDGRMSPGLQLAPLFYFFIVPTTHLRMSGVTVVFDVT